MNKRRGSVMVEFAVGASLVLAISTGIFQLGFAMFQYNVLLSSVRQAAHHASTLDYKTNPSAFRQAVAETAVFGFSTQREWPIVPGLTTADISVEIEDDAYVTVTVNKLPLPTPLGSFTLAGRPSVTFPIFTR